MNTVKAGSYKRVRPIMKWAGGKSQLLDALLPMIPNFSGKYIEPFFGGGALFFAMRSEKAVISDSNPELVNLYTTIAKDVESVIEHLQPYQNDKDLFYHIRALDWTLLKPAEAAARTLFLNKTCFNGLYRVNKKGGFNVPFGNYKKPNICDSDNLREASRALSGASIICSDYKDVLRDHCASGDFVFLDPPYLPISEYSDFKRYTKEQFYEEDQIELAKEVHRLHDLGCHVILTNSNHPLIHELYSEYEIHVHQTKRNISCRGSKRKGEDLVVNISPKKRFHVLPVPKPLSAQVKRFPSSRYMGSKQKLLPQLREIISQVDCSSAMDLFSGSSVVSYMLKAEGLKVVSNDYMALSNTWSTALIENNNTFLSADDVDYLLTNEADVDDFVQKTFKGIYFPDEDNKFIDLVRSNAYKLKNKYKRSLALSALCRACFKKRPRGIFTYTGFKYDDGRKDLKLSFEEQFLAAVKLFNKAVFDNGQENKALRSNALDVKKKADLIYIDPPYYSPHSDNEYVRRYHFVEGIACNWEGVEMQWHTKTKKFKNYPTPFSTRVGAKDAFDKLFKKFRSSTLVVSYSSNSLPCFDEMTSLMSKYKSNVEVISLDYRYSFGNQGHKVKDNKNKVQEYIFIGY